MYITYNYNTDSEWESVQSRTIDPYAILQSDTLNKINSIYGNNLIISGFDLISLQRNDILRLIMNPGKAIKDSILIEITKLITIELNNRGDEFLADFGGGVDQGLIVLNYKYEKVSPPPQAKVEFIKESEYDPEKQLALYRLVFDNDGNVEILTRIIEPKDNVIYEQMLTELESVAKTAVNSVLAELGNDGIGELIGCYMRCKGTSVSGDYTVNSGYYLLHTISKYEYKDLLEIRLTVNTNQEYHYGKYYIRELESINSGTKIDVNYEILSTVNTDLNVINDYATMIIYETDSEFKIYLKLDGAIRSKVEVIETSSNSDEVMYYNIEKCNAPDLTRETFVWKSSDIENKPACTYVNGYMIWNQYNMGSGSGLNADLLDGRDASYFASQEKFDEFIAGIEQTVTDLTDTINQNYNELNDKIENLESYFDPISNTELDKVVLQSEKSVPGGIPVLNEDGVVPENQLDVRVVAGVTFHSDDIEPTASTPLVADCYFTATKIFNPTYKDIAECFECESDLNAGNVAHRIVSLNFTDGKGKVRLSNRNDRSVIGVVSDTYGILLGGTQELLDSGVSLVPVAVCGTAWVELEEMEDNKNYLGCLVGPGDDGYGRIVTRAQPHVGMIVQVNEGDTLVKVLVRTGF